MENNLKSLKVSGKSNPNSVAGAIAGILRDRTSIEIQTIGAAALNQAIKAVAIARGFLVPAGIDIVCVPSFSEVEVQGEDRTGIKLTVKIEE